MTTPTNNTETTKKQWLQLPTNATNSERMVAEYNAFKSLFHNTKLNFDEVA